MASDSQVALPKALKRDELRFVKIEREEKHPFEKTGSRRRTTDLMTRSFEDTSGKVATTGSFAE